MKQPKYLFLIGEHHKRDDLIHGVLGRRRAKWLKYSIPFKPADIYKPHKDYVPEPFLDEDTPEEKVLKFIINFFISLFMVGILFCPILVFLSPTYWAGFKVAPVLYTSSLLFFFIPFIACNARFVWRNFFFIMPFSISFTLVYEAATYQVFLKNYFLYLGLVATILALYRNGPPYRYLEYRLYITDYFMNYFEVRKFWRVVVILISPIFIPSLFTLFNTQAYYLFFK